MAPSLFFSLSLRECSCVVALGPLIEAVEEFSMAAGALAVGGSFADK